MRRITWLETDTAIENLKARLDSMAAQAAAASKRMDEASRQFPGLGASLETRGETASRLWKIAEAEYGRTIRIYNRQRKRVRKLKDVAAVQFEPRPLLAYIFLRLRRAWAKLRQRVNS